MPCYNDDKYHKKMVLSVNCLGPFFICLIVFDRGNKYKYLDISLTLVKYLNKYL